MTTMTRRLMAAALLYAFSALCTGQETAAPPEHKVVIASKINGGDLPYRGFYKLYMRLLALLPPPPRIIAPVYQMSFANVPIEEEDNFLKPSWNVAIVGTDTDIDVPILRGGYFDFPDYRDKAAKDATIMFNTQTKKNFLRVAWKTRLRPNQALGFADMQQALAEVRAMQKNIPWYALGFRAEKTAQFDAIKACFAENNGELHLEGALLETIHSARCRIYKPDPALLKTDGEIRFSPAPEIVVLEDSARYRPALTVKRETAQ